MEDSNCTHLIIDAIPGDPIDLGIDLAALDERRIYTVYKEVRGFFLGFDFIYFIILLMVLLFLTVVLGIAGNCC